MNILITGIHGFVGSNLVNSLKGEHCIFGLDIISPDKDGVIKTFSYKELDENKLPKVDAIIHLAGKAHDTKKQTQAQVYFDINTELTKKVYNYYLNSDISKFIFFSSVKAVADKVIGDVLTEDVCPVPVGPYGESKVAAENYILSNMPSEKQVYILRPCMIHGPGNKGNLNLLYKFVEKGIPWPLGAYENLRSFISIDNVSFIIAELLKNNINSGIYNIADDEPLSTNKLIEIICVSLGRRSHIWKLPVTLINYTAKIGGICKLPLNQERLDKLTENYVVSNIKLKKELGIETLPISSHTGILDTLKSFVK